MEKTIDEQVAELQPYALDVYEKVLDLIELSPFTRKEMLSILSLVRKKVISRRVKKVS